MALCLGQKGFAIAYDTVSVGDVADEMRNAAGSLDELRADRHRASYANALGDPELMFVLGQADIGMMLETRDFRSVFELRYPRVQSLASAVNWVFSVPYVIDELRSPAVDEADSLRFVLHLRLRRSVYAYRNAEEKIVRRLAMMLFRDDIPARIHAGLGWSDLIIDGRFTRATFEKMIGFIVHAHGLRLQISGAEPIPVLQRMLTVIGYVGKPPAFPDVSHVTFLRALPGAYDEVVAMLKKLGTVTIMDGKADFLVTTTGAKADWLEKQRTLGEKANRKLLQKVETHVMYFRAEQFDNASLGQQLLIDAGAETLHRTQCECEKDRITWIGILEREMKELERVLPREQRHAIDNILFLLATTLRDARSICCDVHDAVMACFHGLLTILKAIAETNDQLSQQDSGWGTSAIHQPLLDQYDQLTALWRRLDEWHRFADLLLRQRTVGSYEEILGQSDRSVVYSGGVQKFLYLADSLLNEFAKRIDPYAEPFATIYDSVKTILSLPTGLVRMPTASIFKFPPSIVDLWHEAATTVFRYRHARQIVAIAPAGFEKEFAVNLADYYADILVYLHGFGGHFEMFLASLAYYFQQIYRDVVFPVRARAYNQFLTRVYLVYEFHSLRDARRRKDNARLNDFLHAPERVIVNLIAELRAIFKAKNVATRYPSLDFPDVYWDLLELPVTSEHFTLYHRNIYLQFLRTPAKAVQVSLQDFERGEIKTFISNDDLNGYYAQLAHYIEAFDRDPGLPFFTMMASLGKSVANEYHRRQITARP